MTLHPWLTSPQVRELVDRCIAEAGLTVTLCDTLRKYPGSTHWHVKRGRDAGVLEITFWPRNNRLWFSVHQNRYALWIETALPTLYNEIKVSFEQVTRRPVSS